MRKKQKMKNCKKCKHGMGDNILMCVEQNCFCKCYDYINGGKNKYIKKEIIPFVKEAK